jgi:hypothetical protein
VIAVLFINIALFDFLFGSLGFYATKARNIPYLRIHVGYRIVAMLVATPFVFGFMLFDEKLSGRVNLFILSIIILSIIVLEIACTIQVCRLILYELKLQQHTQAAAQAGRNTLYNTMDGTDKRQSGYYPPYGDDAFLNGFAKAMDLPSWAYADPMEVMVFFDMVPLQLAVTAFSVATVVICTTGILCLVIFPGSGLALGVYTTEVLELRFALFVTDALGLYFGFLGLTALKERSAHYLNQFFVYQIGRLCVHIPIMVVNSAMMNTCNLLTQSTAQISMQPTHAQFSISCKSREVIYLAFVGVSFAVHAYFIRLTYDLQQRYDFPMLIAGKGAGQKTIY